MSQHLVLICSTPLPPLPPFPSPLCGAWFWSRLNQNRVLGRARKCVSSEQLLGKEAGISPGSEAPPGAPLGPRAFLSASFRWRRLAEPRLPFPSILSGFPRRSVLSALRRSSPWKRVTGGHGGLHTGKPGNTWWRSKEVTGGLFRDWRRDDVTAGDAAVITCTFFFWLSREKPQCFRRLVC